jgi:hypothetical protein
MIIKLHILFLKGIWTDEAIEGLVGQNTKVAGCPGKVVLAERCPNENAMHLSIKVDPAYDSYLEFVNNFKQDELEGISLQED